MQSNLSSVIPRSLTQLDSKMFKRRSPISLRQVSLWRITRVFKQFEQQGLVQRLPNHLTLLQSDATWHYQI